MGTQEGMFEMELVRVSEVLVRLGEEENPFDLITEGFLEPNATTTAVSVRR